MAQIHHFDHGWLTPTFSYLLSVLGSYLGLVCAVRLRSAPSTGWRVWWLGLAAVAIGGTGIWTMHFVAMLGFSVVGTPIRYDVGLTAASAVIAVVTVGLGLVIALLGESYRRIRTLIGGLLAGLGVAAMHYTGMAAMRLNGDISYAPGRVTESVVIAVIAATVAIWLALTVSKPLIIFVSALVMGIAVNGMHFTGMTAMSVHDERQGGNLPGASASGLLIPIGLAVIFGVFGLVYALIAAPTDEDRAGLAYIDNRQNPGATAGAAPADRRPDSSSPATSGVFDLPPQPQDEQQPPQVPPTSPIPQQPTRQSRLNGSNWTYRDRTPR
jgi:NO-binding membrane sensor protein with MHYT domain